MAAIETMTAIVDASSSDSRKCSQWPPQRDKATPSIANRKREREIVSENNGHHGRRRNSTTLEYLAVEPKG